MSERLLREYIRDLLGEATTVHTDVETSPNTAIGMVTEVITALIGMDPNLRVDASQRDAIVTLAESAPISDTAGLFANAWDT